MTTVQSSQGGSAYATALAKLLERMQSTQDDQSGLTSATSGASTGKATVPSLASVLTSEDAASSSSTQTSSAITALMMDIQQLKSEASSSSSATGSSSSAPGAPPSPSDIFKKTDTDGDGSLSLAEFVAGRPKDMSEEDATTLFKSIDSEGTGSISEDQLAANMKAHHASHAKGSDTKPDIEALAKDIITQLKQVIQTFNNGYVETDESKVAADTSIVD